jgi:hypothetical protein
MQPMETFGTVSYAISALLFTILGLLLLTSWRGRMQGTLLILALFASAFWAALLAVHSVWAPVDMAWIWALETLRDLAWLTFLGRLLDLQFEGHPAQQRALRRTLGAVLGVGAPFVLAVESWGTGLASLGDPDRGPVQPSLCARHCGETRH